MGGGPEGRARPAPVCMACGPAQYEFILVNLLFLTAKEETPSKGRWPSMSKELILVMAYWQGSPSCFYIRLFLVSKGVLGLLSDCNHSEWGEDRKVKWEKETGLSEWP